MLFATPEKHAANPPSTWTVRKSGRKWQLCVGESVLGSFRTKREAEAGRTSGFYANLYEKERRWYAGENIPGWHDWRDYKKAGVA